MKKYVVGFLFDEKMTKVVLIEKNRPQWYWWTYGERIRRGSRTFELSGKIIKTTIIYE